MTPSIRCWGDLAIGCRCGLGEAQDHLGAWRQRNGSAGAWPRLIKELSAEELFRDASSGTCLCGLAVGGEHTEHDVLGADVVVV
jgi:hypothetical protein